MDWNTLAASILGSAGIVGVCTYLLKRSFDRALDIGFARLEERYRGEIKEELRRQAAVFDQQFGVVKGAVSLIYRVRNELKDMLATADSKGGRLPASDATDRLQKVQHYHDLIRNLLHEERAILPQSVFAVIHEARNRLQNAVEEVQLTRARADRPLKGESIERLRRSFGELDESYARLVAAAQEHLGLSEKKA